MNIIDILVNFVIFYSVCIFLWFFYMFVGIYVYLVATRQHEIGGNFFYRAIKVSVNTILNLGKMPFFIITILFLILYIVYLIIITIIPPTGFATLFIPVREMLMSIPPLQALKDRGVFDLYGSAFKMFGFSGGSMSNRLLSFSHDYMLFSKDNIIEMIGVFNPNIDREAIDTYLVETMANKEKTDDNIKKDVEVCINNNSSITTPDMEMTDEFKATIDNVKNNITCNMKSIKPYILENI